MKRFKVFKKLCSLALILSMLVSMIPMNVFATTTKSPVIDGNKTGSLTINKYDMNYAPSNRIPIPGIPFTIYKIFDIGINSTTNELTYNINSNFTNFFDEIYENQSKEYQIEAIKKMNGSELEELAEDLEEYIKKNVSSFNKENNNVVRKETNENGVAEFTTIPLGYYFVVEEKLEKPDNTVEDVINPFFVSIPMTASVTDEDGNVEEMYWDYDVEASPKNITNINNLKLIKYGKVGNADSTLLGGVKFDLEKQNEDGTWTKISDYVTSQEQTTLGQFTVTDYLDRGTYRLKETEAPEGYILDAYVFKVEYSEKLKELTYLYNGRIFPKSEGLTITALNEKPTIDKKGSVDNGTTWTDDVTSHIGKDVKWTITTTVPSTIKRLKTYTIIDTLSEGLTFDKTTAGVVVTKNGTQLRTSDYTLDVDSSNKVLTFNFNEGVLNGGEQIVIQYKTRLNENAVIGSEGNPNIAELHYSKATTTHSTTDDIWEPEDTSKVYTGGVNIFKHDGNNSPLGGAEFQIYGTKADALAQTNPIKVLVSGELVTTVTSGTDGIVSFTGLAYGTLPNDSRKYWVVETKAPEDFNLLKEPFEVTVNATSHTLTAASADITKVLNKKGFTLPETGGMGTVIFTVAGLGMMGLAGAAYIALKRKESQQ